MKRTRRLEMMPLGSITGAEKNPKKHAHADIGKSIGRFGYVEPVVLDERTQRLVAGHGRVQALRAAKVNGEQPPQGVEVGEKGEWLVPVLRGWSSRSDAEASAYLVASNNLTTKGGWDNTELADLLKSLDQQAALDGTGYGSEDISKLLAMPTVIHGETDAFEEWQGMPEFENPNNCFRKIIVNFADADAVTEFAELIGQKLSDKTKSIWHPYQPPRDLESMRYDNAQEVGGESE